METPYLDRQIKRLSDLATSGIKEQIKSQGIWRTGDLYRSIESTVKPIATGNEISTSMIYYGEYVNDGTDRGIKPRRFVERGIASVDEEMDKELTDALEKDIDKEVTDALTWQ